MPRTATLPTLDRTLTALADPTRRAILQRLSRGEARVTELAQPFAMSLNGVSKHIRMLERAELVRRRRSGASISCRSIPTARRGRRLDRAAARLLDGTAGCSRSATAGRGRPQRSRPDGRTPARVAGETPEEKAMTEHGAITAPDTVRMERVLPGPIDACGPFSQSRTSGRSGWPVATWNRASAAASSCSSCTQTFRTRKPRGALQEVWQADIRERQDYALRPAPPARVHLGRGAVRRPK